MSSIGSKSESNSPVPPGSSTLGTPSPLIIGKSFIKQYYQVLSTDSAEITKFYKPNSVLSHSLQPSVPTVPQTLSSLAVDQFFHWAKTASTESDTELEQPKLCFDFGSGAIDAQESVNGGILLVVTGRITLPNQATKTFVQTFFLNNGAAPGKKRQFYVHNDILRFLEEESQGGDNATLDQQQVDKEEVAVDEDGSDAAAAVTSAMSSTSLQDVQHVKPQKQSVSSNGVDAETTNEKNASHVATDAEEVDDKDDEEDGNAVTGPTDTPQAKDEKKSKKNRSRGRSRKARSSSPTDVDKKGKPTKVKEPGSWASLVAGKSSSGAAKPSPVAVAAAAAASEVAAKLSTEERGTGVAMNAIPVEAKEETLPKKSAAQKGSSSAATPADQATDKSSAAHRTPEATILIKNLPDKAKEGDIRAMFKPYADKLNKKILGITLLASRGFAFVDFDSKVVAEAVVKDSQNEKKGEEKFVLNGKVLEVGRKVPQENSNKSAGVSSGQQRRSKSPGNNTKSRGGRKSSPRGGNRAKK